MHCASGKAYMRIASRQVLNDLVAWLSVRASLLPCLVREGSVVALTKRFCN